MQGVGPLRKILYLLFCGARKQAIQAQMTQGHLFCNAGWSVWPKVMAKVLFIACGHWFSQF